MTPIELKQREKNIKKAIKILNENKPNQILLLVNDTHSKSLVIRYETFFAYMLNYGGVDDKMVLDICYKIVTSTKTELTLDYENKPLLLTFLFLQLY